MTAKIKFLPEVSDQLRQALIFEEDLLHVLRTQTPEEVAEHPGCYRYLCPVPVPRPMDPETAELRTLEVFLKSSGENSWQVYAVRGLETAAAAD